MRMKIIAAAGSTDHAPCDDIPKTTPVPLDAKSTYECEGIAQGDTPQGVTNAVHATTAGPRVH